LNLAEAKKALLAKRSDLMKRQGAREQMLRQREEEESVASAARLLAATCEEAHLWLLTEISDRRKVGVEMFENAVSPAIGGIYGPGFGITFVTYDEKREKEGIANFKMSLELSTPFEGEEASVELNGGSGGGAVEAAGTWSQITNLGIQGYGGPFVMDEAFSALSRDGKLDEIGSQLRQYGDISGRQVIFATHMADIFGPLADQTIRVTLDGNGTSHVHVTKGHGSFLTDEDGEEDA
jgi:hypothetical protein